MFHVHLRTASVLLQDAFEIIQTLLAGRLSAGFYSLWWKSAMSADGFVRPTNSIVKVDLTHTARIVRSLSEGSAIGRIVNATCQTNTNGNGVLFVPNARI